MAGSKGDAMDVPTSASAIHHTERKTESVIERVVERTVEAGTSGGHSAADSAPVGSTKQRAEAIALRLFTERGYDATSMREIAEELGVSKAALYYHFKSKEDIVRSLLDGNIKELDELGARSAAGMTVRELLDAWCQHCLGSGLRLHRFNMVNLAVLKNFGVGRSVGRERLNLFLDRVTPEGASGELRLRLRTAFFSIGMTAFVGEGLDLTDAEMVELARVDALASLDRLNL